MKKKQPKIVIWDLETMPNPVEVIKRLPGMGAWPGRTLKADLNSIICFGYKIYGEKRAHSINGWDFKRDWKKNRHNDYNVVKAAYEMLKDADAIVTHNGAKFDVKHLNTRLIHHGFPRLPKVPHFDTKQLASRNLYLFSNSLAQVAKHLGCTDKMQINNKWQLWVDLSMGTDTAKTRKVMDKYCKQDVDTLEEVFNKLKQYSNAPLNYNLFKDPKSMQGCPTCGSFNVKKDGKRRTKTQIYQRIRCNDCGTVSQQKLNGGIIK